MVYIIVPAYNEAKNIGRVLRGLFEHGYVNVVVVDDGSTDNTAELAFAAGATVLRHVINRGQGAALQTGNEYAYQAGAAAVAHFDADGQFDPADIAGAIELLKTKQLDVVLGSRFLDSRSSIPWFKRYILLPVSRWINYVFTGLKLTDAHNGFRAFSGLALRKIAITHDRMAHNSEIVAKIKANNLRFEEYPVAVAYFERGQGIGEGFRIIRDLLFDSVLK